MSDWETINKLEERVEKSLGGAKEVEEIVDKLLDAQESIYNNIENIKYLINAPLSKNQLQLLFSGIDFDRQEYYTNILLGEMNKAITQTKEYDLPLFRKRLVTAIRAPGTIQITVEGEGKVRVSILPGLRKNAGTLAEWLTAVKKTREELKIKHKSKPAGGKAGSDMYEEKIYKPAREGGHVERDYGRYTKDITEKYNKAYYDTLRSRLNNVTSLAPWWEYLEYGTDHGPATAGGRAYPHYAGTHFVAKATIQIIKSIKNAMFNLKRERNSDYEFELEHYNKLQNKVYEALHKIQNTTIFTRAAEVNKAARIVNGAITTWLRGIRTGKYKGKKLSVQAELIATKKLKEIFLQSILKGELTNIRMRGKVKGEDISTRTILIWNELIVPNLEMLGIKAGKV